MAHKNSVVLTVYHASWICYAKLCLCLGRWTANVNGGELESLGYKEGYRVDVDVPDGTWEKAPFFHDILIFNTGHW